MSLRLSSRAGRTSVSGIRKMFEIARTLKNPINFSIGQPDFPAPENIKQAACAAIMNNRNAYTPTQGCPELVDELSKNFSAYARDQILVTSAVSGGLTLAFLALLDPDDEILIPDPYFLLYKQLALLIGARPIFTDTYPDFSLHPERIEAQITAKTRAIILGSPSNPTGAVYSEADLREVAAIAKKHNIALIFDAIYAEFCYDESFVNVAEFYRDGTIYLGGFSKSHSLTGWRLGYALGAAEIIQTMAKFQQFTFVCAPSMAQLAGVDALRTPPTGVADDYRLRRDQIYRGLCDAGYEVEKPHGAFYIFPRAPWGTASEFCDECLRRELMIVPGGVFSERDTHFRISYATSPAQIDRGLAVLKELRHRPHA